MWKILSKDVVCILSQIFVPSGPCYHTGSSFEYHPSCMGLTVLEFFGIIENVMSGLMPWLSNIWLTCCSCSSSSLVSLPHCLIASKCCSAYYMKSLSHTSTHKKNRYFAGNNKPIPFISIYGFCFNRYTALLFGTRNDAFKPIDDEDTEQEISFQEANKKHRVTQLRVKVHSNDQSLGLQTDEEYTLNITKPHSILEVATSYNHISTLWTQRCITWLIFVSFTVQNHYFNTD